jgi:hypothetical protein
VGDGVWEGDTVGVGTGDGVAVGDGVDDGDAVRMGVGLAAAVGLGIVAKSAVRRLVTTMSGHSVTAPARPRRPRPDTFGLEPVS